jgi:quercetin dioxygenase-like cupin family protein
MRLYIGNHDQIITPGDSWCIPSNVKHRAEVIDDSVAIEVFSPCRDEYKQYVYGEDIR